MIDLAEHYGAGRVKLPDICLRKSIPRKYLEQIFSQLKGAGYIRSARGPTGGYRLARSPSKTSVAEVVRLIDGAIAPVESVSKHFYDHTPIEANRKLLNVFKEIRDHASRKLEGTRLSHLI